jgi:SAM-dependent methyltransferase
MSGEARAVLQQDHNVRRMYPEIGAGGYAHVDGSIEFYLRINALLKPEMVVLDFGAGRGALLAQTNCEPLRRLVHLQGRVAKLVGVDVDDAVLDNPYLDEAHLIRPDERLPFEDASFDLIYSDWVIEHVATPDLFVSEVSRLLKPGGWFCARTPNRWGVTGIATNIIPNKLHTKILKWLTPDRKEEDVFPTVYKLNTRGRLNRYFNSAVWENYSYYHNSTPPYVQRSRILMRLVDTYLRIVPRSMSTNLHVFLRKR